MNKVKVYLPIVARFVTLTSILLFVVASLDSEAMGCSLSKASAKQKSISEGQQLYSLIEEFSFLIQDFKMDHQSETNTLSIKVRYCYEPEIRVTLYPDFRLILNDIQKFLNDYPNEVDFWEIVNKKLGRLVLRNYAVLSSVTIEIQVSPSQLFPYLRSSIVTCVQSHRVRKTPS